MKHSAIAVLALSLVSVAVPVRAQNPGRGPSAPVSLNGEIRGTVVDAESKAPIASASVAVWRKTDSALVAGAMVKNDGSFRIEGLRPGTYYLKLTMIGYVTGTTPTLELSDKSPRANVGALRLTRHAIEIAAVEATAERSVVIAPDRNTYRVKDVAPAASTASDVLDNVPSVNVDGDGKVSLRGNENVVVQINGRPTPMTGTQLAGYLKALPANTIDRVEVVPNPSAKQDPEGMAGIINIVMKQGVDLGTSGGFTLLASTADRYFAGGNVGHQSGPLAVSVNYGFNKDKRQFTGINDRTRLTTSGVPISYTEQDLGGTNGNTSHNITANADYTINKRDVLSTTMQFNKRGQFDNSDSFYSELTGSHSLLSTYNRLRQVDTNNWMADMALTFKRTIVPQKHEISAETRFNNQDDDETTDLWRQAAASAARSDAELNQVDATTRVVTGQIDYTRPVGKVFKLETGVKSNLRMLNRDYQVSKDPTATGNYTVNDLSNALDFSESVNAVYAVLSRTGKKFDVQGGLRAEYAHRDFELVASGTKFPHTYSSLFPSALVNYKMNDKSQVRLSYSRRIRRPGTQELNPFPVFFDLQNVFFGNPQLDPEYTDAVELGYQRSGTLGSLQFAPFYRRTSNIIRVDINPTDTLNGREITSISFSNLDHSNSYGADLNSQFRFGKKFSGLAGINIFKMVTDGGSTSTLSSDAVNWSWRVNGTYNVSQMTTLLGSYFWRAPMTFEKGKFTGQQQANVSVRQKLSTKTTATIRFSDPFKTTKFGARVNDKGVFQATDRAFNARALHLSVNYNFGQTPKLRQRRQEEQQGSSVPFGS
ncbi:MAG TPA: TonB-dependent receptor [Longimicrobiales bacterium]|nr:TonB-dependent receptor [Longimicrobiales bacterium]